jgi:hypothetical protein
LSGKKNAKFDKYFLDFMGLIYSFESIYRVSFHFINMAKKRNSKTLVKKAQNPNNNIFLKNISWIVPSIIALAMFVLYYMDYSKSSYYQETQLTLIANEIESKKKETVHDWQLRYVNATQAYEYELILKEKELEKIKKESDSLKYLFDFFPKEINGDDYFLIHIDAIINANKAYIELQYTKDQIQIFKEIINLQDKQDSIYFSLIHVLKNQVNDYKNYVSILRSRLLNILTFYIFVIVIFLIMRIFFQKSVDNFEFKYKNPMAK